MTLLDADVRQDPVLGEDTWELFEAIEDSFGVDLGDYGPLCGKTIGELACEITERAQYRSAEKCLSAASFFRLRRVFEMRFGIPRADIRPATPLREVLPWRTRRTRWKELEDGLGLDLPKLGYPGWALLLSLVGPAVLLISLRRFVHIPLSVPVVLSVPIIICWSFGLIVPAIKLLEPFARDLPRAADTVGGLSKQILAHNYATFARDGGSSEGDVLKALLHLAAAGAGLPEDSLSAETHIPEDLDIY